MNEITNGVFNGTVLIQQGATIGGAKSVFVKLQGQKDWLVYPTFGGKVVNPFKGVAKLFAGDLVEYRTDKFGLKPSIYIFKTFKVAKTTSSEEVLIERDGYKHIPFVGDILMKAPTSFSTKGAAYTIKSVVEAVDSGKDVWKVTFGTALGSLTAGDVLVEADKEGASSSMLVQNPNMVCAHDYDFIFQPLASPTLKTGARYYLTPTMHGVMYTEKMSPLPEVVKKLNKSRVNGWFEI